MGRTTIILGIRLKNNAELREVQKRAKASGHFSVSNYGRSVFGFAPLAFPGRPKKLLGPSISDRRMSAKDNAAIDRLSAEVERLRAKREKVKP